MRALALTPPQVTYPLDIIRFRMAVDPTLNTIPQVIRSVIRDEGVWAFYKGLLPSCVGIAPYSSINFAAFDLCAPCARRGRPRSPARRRLKKALPEELGGNSTAIFVCSFAAAALVRRRRARLHAAAALTPRRRRRAGATLWTPSGGRCR